ncbi:MAG: hypothetical protein ACK5EA_20695 [Planctomycetaceae bacterium]
MPVFPARRRWGLCSLMGLLGLAFWSLEPARGVSLTTGLLAQETPAVPALPAAPATKPEEASARSGKGAGEAASQERVEKVLYAGEVVLLSEAFRRRGVKSYAEEIAQTAVLYTTDGEIVPLVPDWRGRALFQDERLRDRPVELVVNRRPGVPWVSVLSIYLQDERGKRAVVDYWCDFCSIPMYEIKDCECCQGPIRLRYRNLPLPKDARPAKPAAK